MTGRVLVIGAGPTGLGACWRMEQLGFHDWLLLEREAGAGGLSTSIRDEKGFTWDLGGHVLFSHYEYFDRLMDELLGDAWVEHVREAWVQMRGQFIPYPLQNNIWRLPADDLVACLKGLLEVFAARQRGGQPAPRTFHEWILQAFGQGLADVFMLPYNFKVWAYPPADMNVEWMGERVATVDMPRVLENLVRRRDDCGWGPNAKFRFPLHGGTGAIWESLCRRLPADRVLLGRTVAGVNARERRVLLSDGTALPYDRLISTMPLDYLLRNVEDQPDLAGHAGKLKYSSSHIIGVGMQGSPPECLRTKCWIYFPEPDVPFYRVTVFSNYSPNNVAVPGKQWSLMAEVSESPEKPVDSARIVEDVTAGLHEAGLIPQGTRIESLWYRRLEHGYPTPFVGRDALLNTVEPRLRELGIWSRGRFGGWKYEVANQDHSLMQGVEAANHLLCNEQEPTFFQPNVVNAIKPR